MKMITFSELRNNARKYFDDVEQGETIEIYRKGKPVALLSPVEPGGGARWRSISPLRIEGVSLSDLIIKEREEQA
jgi:prevent-host-death family protein